MPKLPPVHELEFLKLVNNYQELNRKLGDLGIIDHELLRYGKHVCRCWLQLGIEHLNEAEKASQAGCKRAAYSRAYYAAYSASKAVRYIVSGAVSLKGDDHGKASVDLPSDLPKAAEWAETITILYEHRLRADYDNWSDTATSDTLSVDEAVSAAREFVKEAQEYLRSQFGMPDE